VAHPTARKFAVRITDLGTPTNESYVALEESDCRDAADLAAYRTARDANDVITMGKIIVEPLPDVTKCCKAFDAAAVLMHYQAEME
jgi:hypothetical protein